MLSKFTLEMFLLQNSDNSRNHSPLGVNIILQHARLISYTTPRTVATAWTVVRKPMEHQLVTCHNIQCTCHIAGIGQRVCSES